MEECQTIGDREEKSTPGPEPDRLALEGPWEDRVKDALKRSRPAKGWPKPAKKGGKGQTKQG